MSTMHEAKTLAHLVPGMTIDILHYEKDFKCFPIVVGETDETGTRVWFFHIQDDNQREDWKKVVQTIKSRIRGGKNCGHPHKVCVDCGKTMD